jgi:ribonuclease HI
MAASIISGFQRCFTMDSFALFTDVSLNPTLKLGVGCYLLVPDSFLEVSSENIEIKEVAERLILRRFEAASSAELEVRTALWALGDCRELKASGPLKLRLYTDSQCIAGLLKRQTGLEAGGFLSRKTKLPLKNASLYRAFYKFHDELGFEVAKVKGHARSCSRDTVHSIFSFTDREARKALKLWIKEFESKY